MSRQDTSSIVHPRWARCVRRDRIAEAHAELELVAPADQHGACRQYDHSDFLADPTSPQAYDVAALYQQFASAAAQTGRDGMQAMAATWRKLLKL